MDYHPKPTIENKLHVPKLAYSSSNGFQWYEVTWYSKLLTIFVCFGLIPIISFYIGTQYELAKLAIQGTVVTEQ